MPLPNRITKEDAEATVREIATRNAEIAANVAEFAGKSLEELEAMADAHAEATADLKRGTKEFDEAGSYTRRIEDAIFKITG